VNHRLEQWVDGIHHTNTLEGHWSLLKRAIRGTHTHVSAKASLEICQRVFLSPQHAALALTYV
jgi:hypothetical protein